MDEDLHEEDPYEHIGQLLVIGLAYLVFIGDIIDHLDCFAYTWTFIRPVSVVFIVFSMFMVMNPQKYGHGLVVM